MEIVVGEHDGDRARVVHANTVFRERVDERIDRDVADAPHRHRRLAQALLREVGIDAELVPEGEPRRRRGLAGLDDVPLALQECQGEVNLNRADVAAQRGVDGVHRMTAVDERRQPAEDPSLEEDRFPIGEEVNAILLEDADGVDPPEHRRDEHGASLR
jgi:hypothetical protein